MAERRSVAVIGAGISGLACAERLVTLDPTLEVCVFEQAPRVGGLIATVQKEGCIVELGPDSILTEKPAALALAKRLGLAGELLPTRQRQRGAYVVCNGELARIPEGFSMMAPAQIGAVLTTKILSPVGKLRMLCEPLLPRGRGGDESVGRFVRRRFGKEVLERLAQPLMGGIYGTDVDVLSLESTMPRFLALEAEHRSVTLGVMRRQRNAEKEAATGARYGLFVSFRRGMQTLVDALAERLGERVQLASAVHALRPSAAGYELEVAGTPSFVAQAVVLALPARAQARIVTGFAPELADALLDIPYGSTAAATLCYRREDVAHALDAFGFVVPKIERRRLIASTWASVKFEGRAPSGQALLRVFFGGDGSEEQLERDDAELVLAAHEELASLLGVRGKPLWSHVARHPHAMPKYILGHAERVAAIERRVSAFPGLELAGNSLYGVGVPDAVKSGEAAAERVSRALMH